MINTSNEYKQAIKSSRIMYAEVKVIPKAGEPTYIQQKHLRALVLNDDVSGSSSFDIGSAIINQCTLKFDNAGENYSDIEFEGAEINIRIGLKLSDTTEWLQKGTFTAEPGEENGSVITVKAYDNMLKLDRSYEESTLQYPATLAQIAQEACTTCGVPLATPSFERSDYLVEERPDSDALTFREILTWVGQIACCWFRCNVYGAIEAGFYDTDSYEQEADDKFHEISNISTLSKSTEDVIITGVKVVHEETEYFSGENGYVLSVENNGFIQGDSGQTIADLLGEKLIGLRFRKLSASHQSDPSIEAGDLAKVIDRKGNIFKTLLTGTTYQFGGLQKSSCSAASPVRKSVKRFSEATKNYVSLRKMVTAEKTARELAVQNLQKTLAESGGLYATEEIQEDGSTIYYLHDKPTIAESSSVMKLTAEAIGFSTDGGKTYPYGFTITGEMITNVLQTEGINADWINTGTFLVKDKDGSVLFSADMDTGKVIISGDSVMIGDKTAAQAIEDAEKTASLAKNMILQLSNELQTIPVDADGNYSEFPECLTQVTVMYGSEDVSADCTYLVTESDAVTGSWDKSTRTYTMTELAGDNGWVDIKATYAGTLSVTKRFTVTKTYAGAAGDVGSIVIGARNLIRNAQTLEFEDYYFDSGADVYVDEEGNTLVDENGDILIA